MQAAVQPQPPLPRVECTGLEPVTGARTFHFYDVDGPLLSAVRHALVKDVPCLALDYLAFLRNTGPWEPEFIALRVGQLPVAAVDAATGAATDGDGALLEAWVRAPSEAERPCEYTIVYSGDFAVVKGADGSAPRAALVHARSPAEARAVGRGFQVSLLQPGQETRLRAVAHRGTGRKGTRWVCAHVTQVQGPPHAVKVLRVETTGAVLARDALRLALLATVDRLRAAAHGLDSPDGPEPV